jgi:C4-dicarboxylate-specific signal transduction histidine kinase
MSLSNWFMRLVRLPSARQLAEVNERLRREAEAHESTLRELEAARRDLETRVEERTKELSLVKARFETALHGANVYVFSQDRDLRYTWMSIRRMPRTVRLTASCAPQSTSAAFARSKASSAV